MLSVRRYQYDEQATMGHLWIDSEVECYTLEPREDQSQGKPYCIPVGSYRYAIIFSPRFGRKVIGIVAVPGFTAVEMTADATAQTTVFYDSYVGQTVPIFNGTSWTTVTITANEVSMGLDATVPHIASGSLIHPGNFPRDTHGCTLVGKTEGKDFVGHSDQEFDALLANIPPTGTVQYLDMRV